jgi:pimeloyl-ACP methyl ester carboxylesterase
VAYISAQFHLENNMDKYLSSNGVQLCYQDLGDMALNNKAVGDTPKKVILLIAGLGEQLVEWPDSFCTILTNAGFRVIRYDNRDIGLSEKMSGKDYSLNDMANDAAGLLDALEIEHAHVVGMSMGGMIAQILSAERPNTIVSLCLIMSSSGAPGLPAATPEVQEIMAKKTDGSVAGFIENWIEGKRRIDSPGYPADEAVLRQRAETNCHRSYNPGGYMRHLNAIYSNGSRVEFLEKINCPTLILHGKDDPLVRQECGEDLAKHIRGARLELIDGMGHNLPHQLNQRLCDSIIDNIKRVNR